MEWLLLSFCLLSITLASDEFEDSVGRTIPNRMVRHHSNHSRERPNHLNHRYFTHHGNKFDNNTVEDTGSESDILVNSTLDFSTSYDVYISCLKNGKFDIYDS